MRYPEREYGAPEPFPPEGQNWPTRSLPPPSGYSPLRDSRPALTRAEPSSSNTRNPLPRPQVPQAEDEPAERNRTLRGFALCFVALVIGFGALKLSSVAKIGPYGLIQALSPLYYVALILLIISFALHLRVKWHRSVLLSTHLAILVFLVHGAPAIIENAARFETAYIHVGFTDYVADTGSLLPYYDARFDWPSFFEGFAMLDKVAGVSSSVVLLRWWPVAMNLLYLPFIFRIAKQLLRSELKGWVAAGLFPLANWVGQDYFSPQSIAFLLYLAFIYILIEPLRANDRAVWQRLFRRRDTDSETSQQGRPGSPAQRQRGRPRTAGIGFYLVALTLLMAAIATGHQLTPFMAIGSAVVLVIAGRTRVRGIVVVAVLITIGWICYGAVAFWSGHIELMIGGLGNVGGNVGSGVTQRVAGNVYHERAVDSRLVTAALVWGLAGLGALVWRPKNGDGTVAVLLFLVSFGMVAGGNYGGEGVLRVYLFSLPGAVCLIAALISKLPQFWHGQVALCCTLLLLTPLFLLARWGNELFEMARPGELAASVEVYRIAAPGSTIATLNAFLAWQYDNAAVDITEFPTVNPPLTTLGPQALSQITSTVDNNPRGGYVLITTDQQEYGWLTDGMPQNWTTIIENQLDHSPNYKLRYSNSDAEIFQYIPHPATKKAVPSKQGKKK